MPAAELDELAAIYEAKGVSPQTAAQVAAELTAHDALAAHVDVELRLDPDDLANPLQAAAASAASFTVGSLLPLLAIWLPPATFRLPVTFVAVLIALGLAGALSARIGGSHVGRAVLRVVIGGPDEYRQARAGPPLFAAGVNRRRDPRSQFSSRYRHRVNHK